MNIVICHKDCVDGFTASWISHIKFGSTNTKYYFLNYNDNPLIMPIEGNDVLVFDFSFKRPIMEMFAVKAKSFKVFDHHKTAKEACEGLDYCTFDLNKCGSVLAWEYFFPGSQVPKFVQYVQDYDLWQFKLPNSKAINAYINAMPKSIENWDLLSSRVELAPAFCIEMGNMCLLKDKQVVDMTLERQNTMVIGGHRVPVVNANVFVNEVLDALRIGQPFAASYSFKANGGVKFSLRSTDEGVDISEICKQYGGGGHRNAGSFDLEFVQFMEIHSTCLST